MSDNMREVILAQPDQITHSLEVNKNVRVEGAFDSIILAGMGGSGHPGDLLNALGTVTRPLYVHRNYDLPLDYLYHAGFKKPLVITSSYSGNTEEALTAYEQARANNLPLLVSSAGGQLADLAARDGVPHARIDYADMQPRHTLFAAFTGIYSALRNSNLADNIDTELEQVTTSLAVVTPTLEESARALATQIKGKIPVFYASDNLGFAAKNFKIQTNENAKYPGFWNTLPELNHNEMVGMSMLTEQQNPNQFIAVILRDPADHPRNRARMDVTKELYQQWGVTVSEYTATGDTLLAKLFSTITFGFWTTYHLAQAYGIDPVPVAGVESFKDRLKEIAGSV